MAGRRPWGELPNDVTSSPASAAVSATYCRAGGGVVGRSFGTPFLVT